MMSHYVRGAAVTFSLVVMVSSQIYRPESCNLKPVLDYHSDCENIIFKQRKRIFLCMCVVNVVTVLR